MAKATILFETQLVDHRPQPLLNQLINIAVDLVEDDGPDVGVVQIVTNRYVNKLVVVVMSLNSLVTTLLQ